MKDQQALMTTLNQCWMRHDGMWFLHCLKDGGIDQANRLNLAAISSLAPLEVPRLAGLVYGGSPPDMGDFETFKDFFLRIREVVIPDFMDLEFHFPETGRMTWKAGDKGCFACRGVNRLGVLKDYRCGVLHRIRAWLQTLGVAHEFQPPPDLCLHHHQGRCRGEIRFPA